MNYSATMLRASSVEMGKMDSIRKPGAGFSVQSPWSKFLSYISIVVRPRLIGLLICSIVVVLSHSQSFADEIEMFQLINAERQKRGLHPLNYNKTLSNSALEHSKDMAERGYFGHRCPSGSTPGTRATKAGYRWASVGETLFAGSTNASRAVSALMNSLSHRNIILSSEFCDVGIGLTVEKNSAYNAYWTQVFGRRAGTGRCRATNTNPTDVVSQSDGGGSAGGCFITALSREEKTAEAVLAEPLLDQQSINLKRR